MDLHPDTLRRLINEDRASLGIRALEFWMSPGFEDRLAAGQPVDYTPLIALCKEQQNPTWVSLVLRLTSEEIRHKQGYQGNESVEKLYLGWLNAFTQPTRLRLPQNVDFIAHLLPSELGEHTDTPVAYMWGAAIGFFDCALWFTQKGHGDFVEQHLAQIVTEMVYYQWWHGYRAKHETIEESVRSKLSAAIKAYVRTDIRRKKTRAAVVATLESVLGIQHEGLRFTDLSMSLLDQLAYALFGDLIVEERLQLTVSGFRGPLAHLVTPATR